MNIQDYAAHVLTMASKAFEEGNKAECLRLLDVLVDTLVKKRNEIAGVEGNEQHHGDKH